MIDFLPEQERDMGKRVAKWHPVDIIGSYVGRTALGHVVLTPMNADGSPSSADCEWVPLDEALSNLEGAEKQALEAVVARL